MNKFSDRAGAAFGISLVIAVPAFAIAAIVTGEWRYLIGTAVAFLMLRGK